MKITYKNDQFCVVATKNISSLKKKQFLVRFEPTTFAVLGVFFTFRLSTEHSLKFEFIVNPKNVSFSLITLAYRKCEKTKKTLELLANFHPSFSAKTSQYFRKTDINFPVNYKIVTTIFLPIHNFFQKNFKCNELIINSAETHNNHLRYGATKLISFNFIFSPAAE